MKSALEHMLHPHDVRVFLSDIWGRRPLCVRRADTSYFEALFSMDAADELLARSDIWWPGIRIFHRGRQLGKSEYAERWNYGHDHFDDLIDRQGVLDWYQKGATINILGLERAWPSIMTLNRCLEEETGFPVHTTGFLTPDNADNIPAHYDMVEFFALQVAGRKSWRVWQPDRPMPLVDGPDALQRVYDEGHAALRSERVLGEYLLEPGDTLYVPRGFIHQAATTGEASLHVTVGVNVHRWISLVETLARSGVRHLAESEEFRRALPPGWPTRSVGLDREAQELFRKMIESLRRFMIDRTDAGLLEVDRAVLEGRYPARPGQLVDLQRLDTLGLNDVLVRRKGVMYALAEDDERVVLRFHGKSLSCARKFHLALRFICDMPAFAVKDIPNIPDANERLEFARRMIAEGFLTYCSVSLFQGTRAEATALT